MRLYCGNLPEDSWREGVADEMRVFISYGHDRHAALARQLKETLTAAGHQVWFDETNIRHGSAWEMSIEEGLAASDVVIAMMTPHAVRRPDGVCLDELSFARFSGKRILPLMVEDSRPPLCISRLQWLDLRGYEEAPDRTVEKLDLVRSALEMDGGEFEGTEARLIDLLSPLDFDAEIEQKSRGFLGRRWLLDALEGWLGAPDASKAFFLTGAPGTGKTALCAHLSQRHAAVGAVHLCNYSDVVKSDARRAIGSISYQLSTQLPEYRGLLANRRMEGYKTWNAATAFDQLIVQPLRHVARPEATIFVVVDALDETLREGRSELAELLGQSWSLVPSWFRLFVTSRPETAVLNMLARLTPFSLDTGHPDNVQDIRTYFKRELKSLVGNTVLVDRLVRNSEGVFLYASVVVDELKSGSMAPEDLSTLPGGLKSVYRLYFDRHFSSGAPEQWRQFEEYVRPLLEILTAAYEPLPVETLSEILGWDNYARKRTLEPLGSLITSRDGRLSFFHLSFRDWLTDETTDLRYFVDPIRGHKRLADFGWALYVRGKTEMRGELTYLPEHLSAAGRPHSFSHWWEKVKAIEAGGGLTDFICGRCGGGEYIEPRHGEKPSEFCPTCFPERRAKGLA